MEATRIVKIRLDERFPDFDVWLIENQWASSYVMEVTITEEEYKEFKEIQEKYNLMQEYLLTLYEKARKHAKAEKPNS
jgi:hypothetical protein